MGIKEIKYHGTIFNPPKWQKFYKSIKSERFFQVHYVYIVEEFWKYRWDIFPALKNFSLVERPWLRYIKVPSKYLLHKKVIQNRKAQITKQTFIMYKYMKALCGK